MYKLKKPCFFWVWIGVGVLMLLQMGVASVYLSPNSAMTPTLLPGDRVFVEKFSYGLHWPFMPSWQWANPQRGDIVLVRFTQNPQLIISRVIGKAGDVITFHSGVVRVNGKPFSFEKKFMLEQEAFSTTFFEERRFLVPAGHVFVLGDNRDHALDSRVEGFVHLSQVYGKVSFVFFSTTGSSKYWVDLRKHRSFQGIN